MITDYSNRFGFSGPAPTPRNDPKLLELVRCRVLRAFCVAGKRVEVDQVVELPQHDARSLAAIGKLKIL